MWVPYAHPLVVKPTYAGLQIVEADGVVCKAEPATELPLTQEYYVYWTEEEYK